MPAIESALEVPPVRRRRRRGGLWWFVVPALAPYVFVVLVPSLQGAGYAFTNWNGLNPEWAFVGLANFARMFGDTQAVTAIRNTVEFSLVTTVSENVIGLSLALALNSRVKSRHVLRLVFFLPVVVISVVVAFVWQFIYTPNGPMNEVLHSVGLAGWAQNWLGDPNIALLAIAVMVIWQFSGYAMIIYLAGLQGVPEEQLEAAALDGASAVQRFWYVVRPLLGPAITVNLMLSLIRGLMIFDQIWVTTQGGPASSTNSLSTLVYRNAFQYGDFGYSAAMALILAFIVAVIGVFQYRFLLRGGGDK